MKLLQFKPLKPVGQIDPKGDLELDIEIELHTAQWNADSRLDIYFRISEKNDVLFQPGETVSEACKVFVEPRIIQGNLKSSRTVRLKLAIRGEASAPQRCSIYIRPHEIVGDGLSLPLKTEKSVMLEFGP